jgi:LPS sulfotransferase NodH
MLPNFLIIGAQKSGTTWLLEALKTNKQTFIYSDEVHFFNKNENYVKGLDWYESLFDGVTNEALIGEKTPDYFQLSKSGLDIAKRIKADLGEIKLILIMRDPRQRAISAIKHQIRMGRIAPGLTLDKILQGKPDIIKKFKIFEYSKYDLILEYYYQHFSKDNIKVMFYEDIKKRPDHILSELADFLDVENEFDISNQDKINSFNKSKFYLYINYYLPLAKRIALKLDRFIKPANYKLGEKSNSILNKEFKTTLDYFNTKFNTPKEWR